MKKKVSQHPQNVSYISDNDLVIGQARHKWGWEAVWGDH